MTDKPVRRPSPWATAGLVVLVAFYLLPTLYMLVVSFKSQDEIAADHVFPAVLFWQNWPDAYSSIALLIYLRNSAVVAILSTTLTLLIAVPATHAIIRYEIGGRSLPSFILSTYVAPPIVALIPLFFLMRSAGLVSTLPGLVLVYAVMNLPVAFWLLASFVRRLPVELEEAAVIDGAGYLAVLRKVVLPLLAPGIVGTGIICAILAYNEFLLASFLMRSEATQTVPVGLSLFQGDKRLRYGQMAVASLSAMLPVYLAALFFQRWLVRGLTSGAIK
jgi:multiple sugar transport system permease protein